jgi:hypothetical protein
MLHILYIPVHVCIKNGNGYVKGHHENVSLFIYSSNLKRGRPYTVPIKNPKSKISCESDV